MKHVQHYAKNYALPLVLMLALGACGDKSASTAPSRETVAAAASEQVRGFVFTQWAYDIPKENPGDCPKGMNITDEEFFSEEYSAVRDEVKRRYEAGDKDGALKLLPADACQDPNVMHDPGFLLMEGPASVTGLDLDGVSSAVASGGQCPHEDFTGKNGEPGIDYQYYRLMGCVKGMRPDGLYDRLFDTNNTILENGYATLLELKLLSGTPTNGRVEARLFTSAGPVTKDANGKVVPDMSQLVHEDPMFHSAPFPGEIKDGVLTAGPVDAKLKFKVQAIDNYYYFRDIRIRAEVLPDGGIKGILAGYWDSKNIFDFMTQVYIGPLHLGRSAANNLGYQCAGLYHAIPRVADGNFDPATGQCTSVSTVIKFAAVPAFVILPEKNEAVAKK
jgi:hypothetical protein